jgi:hypothetical protein
VKAIRITGAARVIIRGLALIDQDSGTFQSFVLAPTGRFRMAYSGDVKIYENVEALPRALCVGSAHGVASDDEALTYMQRPEFDPGREVVINNSQQSSVASDRAISSPQSTVNSVACHLVTYEPERVVVETNVATDGYLLLTDAYYPGWTATVDGQPAAIERADILFRAVKMPAGQHHIEMRYEPRSFEIGAVASVGAWLVLMGAGIFSLVRRRRRVL